MPLPEIWTSRQRLMILCLLAGLCGWIAWQLITRPVDVDAAGRARTIQAGVDRSSIPASSLPTTPLGDRPAIQGKLNPNRAAAWELSSLPSVGPTRAKAIVDYRNQWMKDHAGQEPFGVPADLQQVKGLGPGIIQQIQPYLEFGDGYTHFPATGPMTAPSTQPAR